MFRTEEEEEAFFNRILDEFAKDEPTDEEVEASLQRFLKRAVVFDPVTGKYAFADERPPCCVGELVQRLRAHLDLSPARFALRFGLTVENVRVLESCALPLAGTPEDVAKATGRQLAIGPLKVLRLLREMEAYRIAAETSEEGPVLLAARRWPRP